MGSSSRGARRHARVKSVLVAVNLLGLPAVTVGPGIGASSRMQQAVQLIGPAFARDLCLDAAEVEASLYP
jgi:Asp-tRNA(Asn)/Glu-tRNA(Gln) amidotransferase A subunit family amidase